MGLSHAGPRCSFCGEAQGVDRRIIAGRGVYICGPCVGACLRLIHGVPGESHLRVAPPPCAGGDPGLKCSFCGKDHRDFGRLVACGGVTICDQCVALCRDILEEERCGPPPAGEAESGQPEGQKDAHPRRIWTYLLAPPAAGSSFTGPQIEAALRDLTEGEQAVLRARFGLGGGAPRTLEDVANTFGVPRERVRQIEAKLLRRLRERQG